MCPPTDDKVRRYYQHVSRVFLPAPLLSFRRFVVIVTVLQTVMVCTNERTTKVLTTLLLQNETHMIRP